MTKHIHLTLLAFVILMGLTLSPRGGARAQSVSVIDFEGIPEGTIVDSVYSGYGVSGDPVDGEIIIQGRNPELGDQNAAMIFDATCEPGGAPENCTGRDADLWHPEWGNILIISEDLDQTDPDDADVLNAVTVYIYADWGPGSVTVNSFGVQDVEEDETEDAVALFYDCDLRDTANCPVDAPSFPVVDIPETGDTFWDTIDNINYVGVVSMLVDLQGSGAVDNFQIETEPTAIQLKSFRARVLDSKEVKLTWETAAEIDNYGFNLYRSQDRGTTSAELVHFEPAAGGTAGHRYQFSDVLPQSGTWYYWLSDVDTSGKETFHAAGFASVDTNLDNWLFMPVLVSSK